MFEIKQFAIPQSIDEAYQLLTAHRNNRLLGGCAFLKMSSKLINQGIDLKDLNLNQITYDAEWITIGATCTYGDLTKSEVLNRYANGLIPKALQPIVGIQLRNVVQVGASVFSRYGFSDLIPALLAVDAEVTLYQAGRIKLSEFVVQKLSRDLLISVQLPNQPILAACQSLRITASDLPLVNCAVSFLPEDGTWKVAVGARPGRARRSLAAEKYLNELAVSPRQLSEEQIACAADQLSQDLEFGSNARASAKYRVQMARVLVTRAIKEVTSC